MSFLDGKNVLVTGGTGSMGKTFVRRALSGEFGKLAELTVFSRDEAKQYDMQRTHPGARYILGDIRDYGEVRAALHGVNVVVNAAALKQVPAAEYNPMQAVLTNCEGVDNLIKAAAGRVEAVVTISTDKACKPTTVMGMTKAIQERMMIAANVRYPETRFVGVRYGNVLASRGSVIPLFHEQIKAGGPVTVTEPNMTRFLLTLDQAVDAMVEALSNGRRGEIYVPRDAPAAKVIDIALELTTGRWIEIKCVGARPNEKQHEIMVSDEEALHTVQRGEYYVILPALPELEIREAELLIKGEYSSRDAVLTPYVLRELLARHGLLLDREPEIRDHHLCYGIDN